MNKKYNQFLVVITFLTLLSWFFSTIFCHVYSKSVNGWFQGGFIGLFFDIFIIDIIIPFVKAFIRVVPRIHWIFKPLLLVDYSYFDCHFVFFDLYVKTI